MSETAPASLRSRLITAIVAMLLFSVIAFGIVAYQVVRRSAKEAAIARLQGVAQQVVEMAEPGLAGARSRIQRAASDPALVSALRDTSALGPARALLEGLLPTDGRFGSVVLYRAGGAPVLAIGRAAPASPHPLADSAALGPLFVSDDSVNLVSSAPVRAGDTILGHLAQTHRLSITIATIERLTQLMGPGTVLLIGNRDGSVWTDMNEVVSRPPPVAEGREYVRTGMRRVSASYPLTGLPLVISVEMPADQALAPATVLLKTFVGIALLVILIGAAVAWRIGRTITEPLASLTTATETMAAGNGTVPVTHLTNRPDEIGVLARAFESMAGQVRAGIETLESQVASRTTQLTDALAQLEAAQADLVRKERLATLGQLSSSVGHELRNPLGVMTNAVYYLEATQRDAPPKVREYLGIIKGQIRISEKIVSDLLDYARIKPPVRNVVQVDAAIQEALGRVAIPHNVSTTTRRSGPSAVLVDPVQIGQVLINLISNAAQAMEHGGTLTIECRGDGDHAAIDVIDTGAGISEEHRSRIFEPLFTTKSRGIGLGLAVSRGLARANDGDLSFVSAVGQGTTFTLRIPIAPS